MWSVESHQMGCHTPWRSLSNILESSIFKFNGTKQDKVKSSIRRQCRVHRCQCAPLPTSLIRHDPSKRKAGLLERELLFPCTNMVQRKASPLFCDDAGLPLTVHQLNTALQVALTLAPMDVVAGYDHYTNWLDLAVMRR